MSLVRIGGGPPPDFSDPIAVLLASHRQIEEQLAALERAAAALEERRDEALAAIEEGVAWLASAGVQHTDDEEASLLPRLPRAPADPLLDELPAAHRATEAMLLALRTALTRAAEAEEARDELRVHLAAYVAAEREHIALEEALVYPLANALTPAELRAIGIEMRLRRG